MFILLILLMCPFVYGHMPVFSSDFANKDVTGKSWALYETIDAGEEILLGLNIPAHENLSFSVNIPYKKHLRNVTYINVCDGTQCIADWLRPKV